MSNWTLFFIFAFLQAMWAGGLYHIDNNDLGRFLCVLLADIFAVIAFECNTRFQKRNEIK